MLISFFPEWLRDRQPMALLSLAYQAAIIKLHTLCAISHYYCLKNKQNLMNKNVLNHMNFSKIKVMV